MFRLMVGYPSLHDINPDELFFYPIVGVALLVMFGLISLRPYLPACLRALPGNCPRCRYDLHGNPEAGCPECGWGREAKPSSAP